MFRARLLSRQPWSENKPSLPARRSRCRYPIRPVFQGRASRYAYYPLSDWQDSHPEAGGGLIALDIDTGDQAWFTPAPKPACLQLFGCSAAQMAPPTATRGAVFAGSLDGHLRAYDSRTGAVIWDFDAAHTFKTVNGVKAHGGSFNNGGPAIANGMLYVSAGYTNELDGNVL